MRTKERAVLLKAIADKCLTGYNYPVSAVAEEYGDKELVFKSARQAGYKVFKKNGLWYETEFQMGASKRQ